MASSDSNEGMSDDLDAVMQYIGRLNTDYAMMITAPWGAGKTHLWKTKIAPEIESRKAWPNGKVHRTAYISLYSLPTVRDLEKAILQSIYPNFAMAGQAFSLVGRSALNLAKMGLLADRIDSHIWLHKLIAGDQLVVCFDDLERKHEPIGQVFGAINDLVEHWNVKAIILCNEEVVDGSNEAMEYKKTKEKLIRVNRRFRCDRSTVLATLIDGYLGNVDFYNYIKRHRKTIDEVVAISDTENWRTLKFSLESMAVAYAELKKHNADSLLEALPGYFLPTLIEFQEGRLVAGDVRKVLEQGHGLIMAGAMSAAAGKKKEEVSDAVKFAEKYGSIAFPMFGSPLSSLADLVIEGSLSRAALAEEVESRLKQKSPAQLAIEAWSNRWLLLEDEDVAKQASLALTAIENGDIRDWEQIVRFLDALGSAQKQGFKTPALDAIKSAFETGIAKLITDGNFPVKSSFMAGHAVHFFSEPSELGKWAQDRMIVVNQQVQLKNNVAAARVAFKALDTDSNEFYVMLNGEKELSLSDVPLSEVFSASEFVDQLSRWPVDTVCTLLQALRRRYDKSRINSALIRDIVWLDDVAAKTEALLPKFDSGLPRHFWLNSLRKESLEFSALLRANSKEQ